MSRPVPLLISNGEAFRQSCDVGSVAAGGSVVQAGDILLVRGAGSDIWYHSDEFRYVYETLKGDGTITAKVESMPNTDAGARAGLMIRETLDPDSRPVKAVYETYSRHFVYLKIVPRKNASPHPMIPPATKDAP